MNINSSWLPNPAPVTPDSSWLPNPAPVTPDSSWLARPSVQVDRKGKVYEIEKNVYDKLKGNEKALDIYLKQTFPESEPSIFDIHSELMGKHLKDPIEENPYEEKRTPIERTPIEKTPSEKFEEEMWKWKEMHFSDLVERFGGGDVDWYPTNEEVLQAQRYGVEGLELLQDKIVNEMMQNNEEYGSNVITWDDLSNRDYDEMLQWVDENLGPQGNTLPPLDMVIEMRENQERNMEQGY